MYLTRNIMTQNNNELTNNKLIYNNETNNEIEDIIQCLICLEQATNENKVHKMKHITLFISNCKCDCNFHLYCFGDSSIHYNHMQYCHNQSTDLG